MQPQSNGVPVPAFDSYEAIHAHVEHLKSLGIAPDSIIILSVPPKQQPTGS